MMSGDPFGALPQFGRFGPKSCPSTMQSKNDILGNTWCINDENIANLARLKQRQQIFVVRQSYRSLQFHKELADDGLCSYPSSRWTLDRQYVNRFCNSEERHPIPTNNSPIKSLRRYMPQVEYARVLLILLAIICFRFV
ncbi:hypothetical protein V8E54_014797 [Elaphomyces granulatus]